MEADLQLINKIIENQDGESLQILVDRHSGIYNKVAYQYRGVRGFDVQSMMDDKMFNIWRAAMDFNPEKKTKFSTYLGNAVRWKCLDTIKKSARTPHIDTLPEKAEDLNPEPSYNPVLELIVGNEALEDFFILLEKEDEKTRKIFEIRYQIDYNKLSPWRMVAAEVGMSIQGCIDRHNKVINKAKTCITQ